MNFQSEIVDSSSNKQRWFILALGVLAQATFSASISGIPVSAVLLRQEFSLSDLYVGVIIGAIYLGISISEVPWGIVTDKVGERVVLTAGTFATGLVLVALWAFSVEIENTTGFALSLSMLLVGIFGGSINGASGKAVMGWFASNERGLAMGIRQTAMPLGGALGAAIVPLIGAKVSMKASFLFLGLLTLAVSFACYVWIREPFRNDLPIDPATDSTTSQGSKSSDPLRNRSIWRLAAASMLLTIPQFAILSFASIFLVDSLNSPLLIASTVLVVIQVLGGALRIFAGYLTDRHISRLPALRWISFATALSLLMLGIVSCVESFWIIVVLITISGVLANSWHGVAYTEIASIVPERAATALGLENTAVFAMGFVTPIFIPLIQKNMGWPPIWLIAGFACMVAASGFIKMKGVQAQNL